MLRAEQNIGLLKFGSVVAGLFGLASSAASTERGAGPWLWLFDLLKWPIDGDPGRFQQESLALNAVLGGVMVGWAVLLYLVASRSFARGNGELVVPMLMSITAWYVVDTTGSVVAGLVGNVVLNTLFFLLFAVPLVALRRQLSSP